MKMDILLEDMLFKWYRRSLCSHWAQSLIPEINVLPHRSILLPTWTLSSTTELRIMVKIYFLMVKPDNCSNVCKTSLSCYLESSSSPRLHHSRFPANILINSPYDPVGETIPSKQTLSPRPLSNLQLSSKSRSERKLHWKPFPFLLVHFYYKDC